MTDRKTKPKTQVLHRLAAVDELLERGDADLQ